MIQTNEQAEHLIEWILQEGFNIEKGIKLELLYRHSEKGSVREFFEECHGKGPTIIIIRTTEGVLFGGYFSLNWNSSGDWTLDTKSFVFNLS